MQSFGFTIELVQESAVVNHRPYVLDDGLNATPPFTTDEHGNQLFQPSFTRTNYDVRSLKTQLVRDDNTGEESLNLFEKYESGDRLICSFVDTGYYPSGVLNQLDGRTRPSEIEGYLNQYIAGVA